MSKVINKKLHPYYKTGINGWIGEEVDDNDYIICPICGEVLGMNYCDYAGEQGYDNKCPKCSQELDYSEIYNFEDTCYFEQLLEIKDHQLAEKEEQLRESRKWFLECDKERLSEETKKNIAFTNYKETLKENEQLKQRLEEIKNVKAQELADYLHTSIPKYIVNEKVELLEKVSKEFLMRVGITDNNIDLLNEIIDNQIEELKKEMK